MALRTPFVLAAFVAGAFSTAFADSIVRWNQAGYLPQNSKVLVVMSDEDLAGLPWQVREADRIVLEGNFPASSVGKGDHTPMAYNHEVDVSSLRMPGEYLFASDKTLDAALKVAQRPYARFIDEAIQHLRMVRSGTDDVPTGRRISHQGDARAAVWVPDGDPAEGRWKPAVPARRVDASGGWYDAGDQMKFTLNEAYTTYVLLLAHTWNPDLLPLKPGKLPVALQEARFGLRYLAKLHPDRDTFIIQVADERDHNQKPRLPENDPLDGDRPALCALSRVHMASTAAALALGARVFRDVDPDAANWGAMARTLYARCGETDTLATAFERGEVNDFYRDPTDIDQLALAAIELYQLTGDATYLAKAKDHAPPPAPEVSWTSWNAHANAAMASHDQQALAHLQSEVRGYTRHAMMEGRPWRVPGRLVWASLHRWVGAAHSAERAARLTEGGLRGEEALFDGMLDYTFGRNPWGVSFVFSEALPNSVRNLYGPLYRLLGKFPTGALSEGPGDRATHDRLEKYFKDARAHSDIPWNPELDRFNTTAAVFADDGADFMTQEATIGGQADLVLMLALAEAAGRGR